MNKKLIRLTESDIHKIVKESVRRVLKESEKDYDDYADYFNGNWGSRDFSRDGKNYRRRYGDPMGSFRDVTNEIPVFDINSGKIIDMGDNPAMAKKYAEETYANFGQEYEIFNPSDYNDIGDWAYDSKDGLRQVYYDLYYDNIHSRNAEIERYGIPNSDLDSFAD